MTSTSEYREQLALDGSFRNWMKSNAAAADHKYIDDFCNGLLERFPVLTSNYKIHLWSLGETGTRASGAGGYQVNIDVGKSGGYTVDVTDDPWEAIGRRIKNEDLVCGADASEEGAGGTEWALDERLRGVSPAVSKEVEEEENDLTPVSGLLVHEL